jgi:agmatinase
MTTAEAADDIDWAGFLALPRACTERDRARVVVLPAPYEATVSYGTGTARGPAAILAASRQVEWYDEELDDEPALAYGIHTLSAPDLPADPAGAVDAIAAAAARAAAGGKLVLGLGGEHTVSLGFVRGVAEARGAPLTVVQLDAHADLRDRYEGSPLSHACVARRLIELDEVDQLVQLGIRSVSREEVDFARSHPEPIRIWYAREVHAGGWEAELVRRLAGRRVYLTLDVDGLDPGVVSATGTPEPGGLGWHQALAVLRLVTGAAEVVGLDCVELAPVDGHHHSDYAVAKLLVKTLNYVLGRPAP